MQIQNELLNYLALHRAGYSADSAKQLGYQLLQSEDVAAAIEVAQADRAARLGVTADMIAAELRNLGFANVLDFMVPSDQGGGLRFDFSRLTRDQAAAFAKVTVDTLTEGRGDAAREVLRVKVDLSDKRAALVDLGKHLGMWPTRVEVSGKDGGPIATTDVTDHKRIAAIALLAAKEALKGVDGDGSSGSVRAKADAGGEGGA